MVGGTTRYMAAIIVAFELRQTCVYRVFARWLLVRPGPEARRDLFD